MMSSMSVIVFISLTLCEQAALQFIAGGRLTNILGGRGTIVEVFADELIAILVRFISRL